MTYQTIVDTVKELKVLGYPIGDKTEVILDYDLRTRKSIIGFAFEDHGYRITIKREIEDDN